MKPSLTIAIATLGRESLFMTLDSIIKNKGKNNIEILIIGDLSSNSRIEPYLKSPYIRLINKNFPSGDLSRKRNIALNKARADIVAFCDDDVKITPFWIKEGLDSFKKNKDIRIVSGPGINPEEGSFINKLLGDTMSSIAAGIPSSRYNLGGKEFFDTKGDKIIGCNFFVLKKIAKNIGFFNPDMIPGEEIDFATRALRKNYKILINPKMFLFHFARPTIKKFVVQNFRFGYSRVRMIKKGIQNNPAYLIPLAGFLVLILLAILSIFSSSVLYALGFYIGIYIFFLLFASVLAVIKNKRLLSFLVFFTIPVMHLSYTIGELKEILFPGRDFKSS